MTAPDELARLRVKLRECSGWLIRLGVASHVVAILLSGNCITGLTGADRAICNRVLFALSGVLVFVLLPGIFFFAARASKLDERILELKIKASVHHDQ